MRVSTRVQSTPSWKLASATRVDGCTGWMRAGDVPVNSPSPSHPSTIPKGSGVEHERGSRVPATTHMSPLPQFRKRRLAPHIHTSLAPKHPGRWIRPTPHFRPLSGTARSVHINDHPCVSTATARGMSQTATMPCHTRAGPKRADATAIPNSTVSCSPATLPTRVVPPPH